MKNFKFQNPNAKWFGQLTILSQVEGQISKFKCLKESSRVIASDLRERGNLNFFTCYEIASSVFNLLAMTSHN